MLPLFYADNIEKGVDLLVENYRKVLVMGRFSNVIVGEMISFNIRADLLKDPRIFWLKTKKQIDDWDELGGVGLTYDDTKEILSIRHDALFLLECPRRLTFLERYSRSTESIIVVYKPPTWKNHWTAMEHKQKVARDELQAIIDLADASPQLTPEAIHARQ